jgi:hypothetical protein
MAQIKLLGKTNIQGKTIFETGPAGYSIQDANAASYIAAVEAADGQALETPVKQAIENFIVGCKSDGIWTALKASCILAGARTLNGALVPLVGTAPTNFNFVSADYNRETGLKGNGSTKYIRSNRLNNADPQDSKHIFVNITEKFTRTSNQCPIGAYTPTTGRSLLYQGPSGATAFYINANTAASLTSANGASYPLKGWGASRNSSTNIDCLFQNDGSGTLNIPVTHNRTASSVAPSNGPVNIFGNTGLAYTNARLSFYSIGESLDLALLDTRVTNLMTALNSAI